MGMTRESLKGLGIDDNIIDQVMKMHGEAQATLRREADAGRIAQANAEKLQGEIAELQQAASGIDALKRELGAALAEAETAKQQAQAAIQERAYDAALSSHMRNIQFKSKLAEKAYMDGLKTAHKEVKDGEILGADTYLAEQQKLDPEAFGTLRAGGEPRQMGKNASNDSGKPLGEYMNEFIRQQQKG